MTKKKLGYENWGILIPLGSKSPPYVPPVHPEARYAAGHKFMKWKLFDYNDTKPEDIPNNKLVECTITGKLYYNEEGLGWVYIVNASEPVLNGGNNWEKEWDTRTYVSDSELDKNEPV